MTWLAFVLILIGVLLNATAQLLLKAGVRPLGVIHFGLPDLLRAGFSLALSPYILGGLACYVLSVLVWLLALSRTAVSIAYPMLSIGYIVTAVAAWLYLGERMNVTRWMGICVIVLGVFLVARSGTGAH
ncbi:MAG TPA: SMR family transporter [Rhodanobacteraceae bacterium]